MGSPELILGLYPQPEVPPETITVETSEGNLRKVPNEEIWMYSADAYSSQPTQPEQGEQ